MTAQSQLQLPANVWPCDCCDRGVERDPETRILLTCRVCGGTGWLSFDPAECQTNPFAGLGAQT